MKVRSLVQGSGVDVSRGAENVWVGKKIGEGAPATSVEGGGLAMVESLGGRKRVGTAVGVQAERVHAVARIKMNAENKMEYCQCTNMSQCNRVEWVPTNYKTPALFYIFFYM